MKSHQLKTASLMDQSFTVPEKQSSPSSKDGMEGFTLRDGWYEETTEN